MSLPDELKFKPEDFIGLTAHGFFRKDAEIAAQQANALLAERLGKVVEVFGFANSEHGAWTFERHDEDTHTAYLVGVREL